MDETPDDLPTRFSDPSTVEARRTSFGGVASTYDAVRPPWPEATVDWMLGSPGRALRVLDVGAGTGLGTRTIAGLGHQVVALDPSAEMLQALEAASTRLDRAVAARITSRVGVAEELDLPDGSVDAVTAFQAWHWVDPERAGPECARVLVSEGTLSMAWHSWADLPWLRELGDLVGTPEMVWSPETHGAAVQARRVDGFGPAEYARLGVEQRLTVEDAVRLASSWSPVAIREDRDEVLSAVRTLATRVAGGEGTLVFPYVTDCYRYRRQAS
jgi:SAM-dependent methyltransferase